MQLRRDRLTLSPSDLNDDVECERLTALAVLIARGAVPRAKCPASLAASPRLPESRARTVEQMRLINALYRFVEMAEA